jgi:hypothetical protein
MPVTTTIKDIDRGAKRLAKLLAEGALSVGVLGSEAAAEHEGTDLTVAEVAEIHEFGLGSAPRRSFLAGWFDQNQEQIVNVILKGGQALAARKIKAPELLEQIGQWAVGSIQERIAGNIPPPLQAQTIKRKGSSVALIDKGQLRASISYRVETVKLADGTSTGGK